MLKVASFKISDANGINELLSRSRLASGAHILVSDGYVCIPYEDGAPEPAALQIVAIQEDKNKLIRELGVLTHSQLVNDLQIADAKDDLNVATAAWDKARSNKDLEAKKKRAEARLAELENLYLMNKAEIVRLVRNIDMFDEAINTLSK